MKTSVVHLVLLVSILSSAFAGDGRSQNGRGCETRILSKTGPAPRLDLDLQLTIRTIINNYLSFNGPPQTATINKTSEISEFTQKQNSSFDLATIVQKILPSRGRSNINTTPIGVLLLSAAGTSGTSEPILILTNARGKFLPVGSNATVFVASVFERTAASAWSPPFRDCHRPGWMRLYKDAWRNHTAGLLVAVEVDRCDERFAEVFDGLPRCDAETTFCVNGGFFGSASYWCTCRDGFYHPEANHTWRGFSGDDIESGLIDTYSCLTCPEHCDACDKRGVCAARRDIYLKMVVLGIQAACIGVTLVLGLVVFKQRKCKTIASGMWTILETILLGIFLLYLSVVLQFFEVSPLQCLLEPWAREMGFVFCYGAIVLKLYRHMIEFRTRKAHRWVVKDTDLLKYLLIMVASLFAYMAAYTAISLNFMQENYSLLYSRRTSMGAYYEACKPLWWDYVTEIAEMTILIFGIHMGYVSRNARTQFHERKFLCAAICIELAVSGLFYVGRVFVLPGLHPDGVLIINCVRTQLTATITMALVFVPKFWYQQKQVRSLAQEYSCRLPVDAFKDVNAHGPLTGNNSDVDVGEVTLADMSPDDIRAELKRLYLQLEIFKSKTICRDNPHISKRRGGRKAQHRRFSLQKKGSRERNLYGKHRTQKQPPPASQQAVELEITEAEPSRTPEDSVCSVEGPSNVYSELQQAQPSTTADTGTGTGTSATGTSTTAAVNNSNNVTNVNNVTSTMI
ncbi:metabotropic glycine receptor isoform X2 [Atheta coriaria]|uniref:metabotropic glycine receptor isoform X2 n=1 Tax=Dalotia coriaria TaxID=877792 RepID=UPI0031F46C38